MASWALKGKSVLPFQIFVNFAPFRYVHSLVQLPVHLPVHSPVHSPVHLPVHLSVHSSVHSSVHLPVHSPFYLPAHYHFASFPGCSFSGMLGSSSFSGFSSFSGIFFHFRSELWNSQSHWSQVKPNQAKPSTIFMIHFIVFINCFCYFVVM